MLNKVVNVMFNKDEVIIRRKYGTHVYRPTKTSRTRLVKLIDQEFENATRKWTANETK